jgi:hypothetical protein
LKSGRSEFFFIFSEPDACFKESKKSQEKIIGGI